MPNLLAVSGSTRRDPWNRTSIRVAAATARTAGGDLTLMEPGDYPLPCRDTGSDPVERARGPTIRPKATSGRL